MNAPPSAPRRIRRTPSSSSDRYASLTDTRLVLNWRAISRSAGSLWPARSLPSEICFLIRRTMVSDTRPWRSTLASMTAFSRTVQGTSTADPRHGRCSAALLRLFRVAVELEVEAVLRLFVFETRTHHDCRRECDLRNARVEEHSARRGLEWDRLLAHDDAARESFRDERPRVLVVDVQPELRRRWMRRLNVPVVRRHDEVAAVLRVVVAVRPQGVLRDARAPVDRALAGVDLVHPGM